MLITYHSRAEIYSRSSWRLTMIVIYLFLIEYAAFALINYSFNSLGQKGTNNISLNSSWLLSCRNTTSCSGMHCMKRMRQRCMHTRVQTHGNRGRDKSIMLILSPQDWWRQVLNGIGNSWKTRASMNFIL